MVLQDCTCKNITNLLLKPSPDCNTSFTDLFESGPEGFHILPVIIPDNDEGKQMVQSMAEENKLSFGFLDSADREDVILSHDLVMSSTDVLLTFYDGESVLRGVPCQYYLQKKSAFLSALVPIKEAQDLLLDIEKQYFTDRIMIGVHVRMHDPQFDWRVVPPFARKTDEQESSSNKQQNQPIKTAMSFDEGATVDDFKRVMDGVENKFSLRNKNGEVTRRFHRFYLASNSEAVKQHFLSQFPDILTISGDYERHTPSGMYFALIEWLLLSRAALVINTYGSSYGAVAASVHQVPVVGIWGDVNIHHSNPLLPYCGIMQFIKAYGNQGYQEQYLETTVDNRIVNGRVIPLVSCNHLQEWGISDMYCSSNDENLL